ncbi:MAG: 4Fe-4S binding protein [Candidatus Diapherotrites archaeon]
MGKFVDEAKIKNAGVNGVPHAHAGKHIPKMGSWATHVPKFDRSKCIKCHLCWIYCPDTAIKLNKDGTTRCDYGACKGCGTCASVCPTKCITMERHKG